MQICPVGTYRQRGWWLWACSLRYLHCALVFCWSTVTCHFRLLINYSGCCTSSSTSFSFPSSLPCSSSSALFFWLFYLVWLCLTHYAALNSWSSSCLSLLSAVMTGMNCHTAHLYSPCFFTGQVSLYPKDTVLLHLIGIEYSFMQLNSGSSFSPSP